jgi:DNA-binding MarR family transcriptional regulator
MTVASRLDEELGKSTGLRPAERRALDLADILDGATLSEIAYHTSLTESAVGRLVDRLEVRGLARREPVPDDGRRKQVKLVDGALDTSIVTCLSGRLHAELSILKSSYTDAEQAIIDDFNMRFTTLLCSHIAPHSTPTGLEDTATRPHSGRLPLNPV